MTTIEFVAYITIACALSLCAGAAMHWFFSKRLRWLDTLAKRYPLTLIGAEGKKEKFPFEGHLAVSIQELESDKYQRPPFAKPGSCFKEPLPTCRDDDPDCDEAFHS